VNYTVKEALKALNFIMRTLRKGNSNTKRLAYTSGVPRNFFRGGGFEDRENRDLGVVFP